MLKVDRLEPYSWKVDGVRLYRCFPSDHGRYVSYSDYAALESRMTGIISGVQLELEDERKKRLAAEARVAELEKDAARYRWVRDTPWISDEFGHDLRIAIQLQRNAVWDYMIDEAMRSEAGRRARPEERK